MLRKDITNDDYASMIITTYCNRNCPFCVDKYRTKEDAEFMTMETLQKHIEVCKAHNIKEVSLLGGEPTCHPKILEICKTLKANGIRVILTTNADDIELVKTLSNYVDSINISYYHQDFLRKDEGLKDLGKDAVLALLSPIGCKEYHKQSIITSKDFKCDVTISALIFKGQLDNKKDLDDYIDLYTSRGFYVKFRTLQDVNDFTNSHKDPEHQFINSLPHDEDFTMYGNMSAFMYKGAIFGVSDVLDDENFYHSLKLQVDGEVTRSWKRHSKGGTRYEPKENTNC